MRKPFPAAARTYLTRLETRIGPAAMTEDIRFALDPRPRVFSVTLQARTNSSRPSYSSFGSLAVDAAGCAYAAGWIQGTLRHGFGAGVEALGAFRDSNAILVKYDSSGVARWARTILEGSNRSCFTSAMVDGSGDVYAAGYLLGAGTFSFGHGVAAATPSSGFNAVLVKYDPRAWHSGSGPRWPVPVLHRSFQPRWIRTGTSSQPATSLPGRRAPSGRV